MHREQWQASHQGSSKTMLVTYCSEPTSTYFEELLDLAFYVFTQFDNFSLYSSLARNSEFTIASVHIL